MNVIFASTHDPDPLTWIKPLQEALPQTRIIPWQEGATAVDAELAIAWNPPSELFLREKNLKAVFNLGAGVDALFRLPGLHKDIAIFRLEDAGMAVQMAEYVLYALLRASRNFDHYQGQQQAQFWNPLADIQRQQWPVGILGTGVMGARVAQSVAALEYPVATWSRSGKDIAGTRKFAGQAEFSDFLANTRVLVNTLPLTPDTRGILCRDTFSQLRPDAYIINVARGDHLIEADLLAMLESGHIKGATLDVFSQEPLPEDHPFWLHPRITITPHVAAASLREETISQVVVKIKRYMRGDPVPGEVAHGQGY